MCQGSNFLTTNNEIPDETKPQQKQSPEQVFETDILQMGLDSR